MFRNAAKELGEAPMQEAQAWHRKQAAALATQLPDNRGDARIVLELTMRLVEEFLYGGDPADQAREERPDALVLAFPAGGAAEAS